MNQTIEHESAFTSAPEYRAFLKKYCSSDYQTRWNQAYDHVQLTDPQRALLGFFVGGMNVLCLAGTWCGDCAGQCPILHRFAQPTSKIHLRFIDSDDNPKTAAEFGRAAFSTGLFPSADLTAIDRLGQDAPSPPQLSARDLPVKPQRLRWR